MNGESPWTYTLTDMLTGAELATLPLTGVKFGRQVNGVGTLGAYLSLADPEVRALNPWSATRPRRTAAWVEYEHPDGTTTCRWGGPVTGRKRSSGSRGLTISAVTWEGWLHRQRLLDDLIPGNRNPHDAAELLLQRIGRQRGGTPNGRVMPVIGGRGIDEDREWLAREVKPILELILGLTELEARTLEMRVDCYRDVDGRFATALVLDDGDRLGRRYGDTQLEFAYPDGGLLTWDLDEDGSGTDNVLIALGAGSGEAQPWVAVEDREAGVFELDSGWPSWIGTVSASDTDDEPLLEARAKVAIRAGQASEYVFSGVTVEPERYLDAGVIPGDDVGLEITDESLEEWPTPVLHVTRVLGEDVTVGDAGKRDQVALTVGGTP